MYSKINSLAPKTDIDIKAYREIIDNTLNELEYENSSKLKNKNIAISGGYGTGKSSIIKTYFKDKNEIIYVSLGSYIEKNNSPNLEVTKEETNKYINTKDIPNEITTKIINKNINTDDSIEISILQQILYSVRPKHVPFSRFNRIDKFNSKGTEIAFTLIMSLIFAPLLIMLNIFLANKNMSFELHGIFLLVVIILLYFLIHHLLKNKISIKKINFSRIELGSDVVDESILNKYVDELIHFFLYNNKSIIVFEDLDRLSNSNIIFSKLKEINTILNTSINNKTIQFIYATSDTIFEDSETRTKFFDAIIPVVPITGGLSFEIFFQEISKNLKIDKEVIKSISKHINYARIALDIVNEYKVYYNKYLNEVNKIDEVNVLSNEDKTQLIYLITYKVLFPSKFNELINREGVLFDFYDLLFTSNIEINRQNEYNKKLENFQIKFSKNEKIYHKFIDAIKTKFNELNRGYSSSDDRYTRLYIDDVDCTNDLVTEKMSYDEVSKKIFNSDNLLFKNKYGEVENIKTYLGYRDSYDCYINNQSLKKSIEEIEKKDKLRKPSQLLDEYINDKNISLHSFNSFELEMIKLDVIKDNYPQLLISNTWDDISYADYQFICKIRGKQYDCYNYEFKDINKVIDKLSESDFLYDNICSKNIFNALINNNNANNYLEIFFSNINNYKFEFLIKYLSENNDNILKKYPLYLNNIWNYFENSSLCDDNIPYIIYLTILYIEPSLLQKDSYFYTCFYAYKESYNILEDNFDLIKDKLKLFEVDFNDEEEFDLNNKKLLNYIYDNNMFKYNYYLITFIIKLKKIKISSSNFIETIYNNKGRIPNIYNYIFKDLDISINKLKGYLYELKDSEKVILEILNNYNLSNDSVNLIINNELNKIKKASNIPLKYLKKYIEQDKIVSNWSNILYLFKIENELLEDKNIIDNYAIKLISDNIDELVKCKFNKQMILTDYLIMSSNYNDINILSKLIDNGFIYTNDLAILKVIYSINGLSDNTFKILLNNSFKLFKNQDIFEDMNSNILIDLIKNIDNKQDALNYVLKYKEYDIFTKEVKIEIYNLIKDYKLHIPKEIILDIIDILDNEKDKIKLVVMYNDKIDINDQLLVKIGDKSTLIIYKESVSFSNNEDNIKYLNILIKLGYISHYDKNRNILTVRYKKYNKKYNKIIK